MQAYGKDFAELYNEKWSAYSKRIAPVILDFYTPTPAAKTNKSVLDLCCGAGHLAVYFLDRGYRVVGIDLSEHMLRHARRNTGRFIASGAAELIQADASDFHLDERFGLIVSTYDSLNHLKDRQALLDCFRCVRAVCEGYFVFDLNTREGLKHWNGVNVEEDGDNLVMIRQGSYDGRSDRAHMKITAFVSQADGSYRRCEETVYNTVFDLAWVKDSLLGAGFTAIHFAPSRDLSEVLADPEQEGRVLVVAS